MTDLLQVSMEFVVFVLHGLFIAVPVVIGAYAIVFSRGFALQMYRYRKAVWKIDYADSDLRVGRVLTLIVGAALLCGGILAATQTRIDSALWNASALFMPLLVGALLLVFQVPVTDRVIAGYPARMRPRSRWPVQLVVVLVAMGFVFVGVVRLLAFL